MSPSRRLHPLALVALVILSTGCSGLRLRPDGTPLPEECPRQALEAMERMGIPMDRSFSLIVDERLNDQWPAPLAEGAVVGYVDDDHAKIPVGTRLYGRAWTGGEKAIIRYYELQAPGGARMPACIEFREGLGGQMKDPSSPPGVALLPDANGVAIAVHRYGERDAIQESDRGKLYLFQAPPEK
jgi:hypothetical protein